MRGSTLPIAQGSWLSLVSLHWSPPCSSGAYKSCPSCRLPIYPFRSNKVFIPWFAHNRLVLNSRRESRGDSQNSSESKWRREQAFQEGTVSFNFYCLRHITSFSFRQVPWNHQGSKDVVNGIFCRVCVRFWSIVYPRIQAFTCFLRNIVNSVRSCLITRASILNTNVSQLTNQRQLIVAQFGFNDIQTTLLGCVDGGVESMSFFVLYDTFLISLYDVVLTIWLGVVLASQASIGRSYAGVLLYIPAILGSILVSALPFSNKIGLLFSYWISSKHVSSGERLEA